MTSSVQGRTPEKGKTCALPALPQYDRHAQEDNGVGDICRSKGIPLNNWRLRAIVIIVGQTTIWENICNYAYWKNVRLSESETQVFHTKRSLREIFCLFFLSVHKNGVRLLWTVLTANRNEIWDHSMLKIMLFNLRLCVSNGMIQNFSLYKTFRDP